MGSQVQIFADFVKFVFFRDDKRVFLSLDLATGQRFIKPVEIYCFWFRAKRLVKCEEERPIRHPHFKTVKVFCFLNRFCNGGNLFEAVLHAAKRDQLHAARHKLLSEIGSEFSVIEGGDLRAGRESERDALNVGGGMCLAENISVQREKLEFPRLDLFQEFRLTRRNTIIARIDRTARRPPVPRAPRSRFCPDRYEDGCPQAAHDTGGR